MPSTGYQVSPSQSQSSSPNFSGLYPLPPQTPGFIGFERQIEDLELADLLKNKHVRELFKGWKDATEVILGNVESHKDLLQQINTLTKEVYSVKTELSECRQQMSK